MTFLAHDFFQDQPQVGVSATNRHQRRPIYVLRAVLHDWDQDHAAKILNALRRCMLSQHHSAHCLIIDHIVRLVNLDDSSDTKGDNRAQYHRREDAEVSISPKSLPLTTHADLESTTLIDLQMMHLFGSFERTWSQWQALLDLAQWELVRVFRTRSAKDVLEVRPIRGPSAERNK